MLNTKLALKNEQYNSIYSKISKSTKNLILASTIQGLPNIFRTNRLILKIVWILLLIASFSTCVIYTAKNILSFMEFETITTIKTIYQPVMSFPAVSICNSFNLNFTFEILYFNFNNKDLKNDWKQYFEIYNDTKYGQCYRFNSGLNYYKNLIKIEDSIYSGPKSGLVLDLCNQNENDFGESIVMVHNQTYKPITLLNKGYFVTYGGWNFFFS